jgi:hypothetical protein
MSAVTPLGEVVRTPLPASFYVAAKPARAWLYGYVRTDHPGYRRITIGGTPFVVTSGTYRFDALVAQIQTDVGGAATITHESPGYVQTSGVVTFPDRLGWVCGFGDAAYDDHPAPFIPPAGIPLYGAQWDAVDVEREREIIQDRSRRQGGYVFGAARVWRWTLTMHRYALEALLTGWCLRGQITIIGAGVGVTMGATEPGGAFTGHALGLDGGPAWGGPTMDIATVRLLVAGTTA